MLLCRSGASSGLAKATILCLGKVLTYDTRLEGYVIDLDRERLKNAPRYGVGEEPFADPAFGQRLGDYYGAR